ncbi:MAG: response regulator [Deltaproteobacteria bacterium]|nr:response regulator [Deltaproteobacteria bacterium]
MSPEKILLADSSADCRELLRHYLEILRYPTPIEANDGEEALSKAFNERPDLIVMEIRLPKMDGFQIVARLRSNPLTRNTYILAATAMALPEDREKCLAKGFNGYLAKPYTLKDLSDLLQTIFQATTNRA